jgi:hypothetical protein
VRHLKEEYLGGNSMTTPVELIHEIEEPSIGKARTMDRAMRDTIQPDLDIDEIWAREVLNRWNAYKKGEVKPIPYEEVVSRYKKL